MGREIERKFLVRGDAWRAASRGGERLRQGYLVAERGRSVRVRLGEDDGATLTMKGETRGATRSEFEVPIPREDAEQILAELCVGHVIDKTRHRVPHAGHTWEVDEFRGASKGLVVAEVELDSEAEAFERPEWLGEEVTGDPRYYNANLVWTPSPPPDAGGAPTDGNGPDAAAASAEGEERAPDRSVLRRHAEARLDRERLDERLETPSIDLRELVHELRVHQIELEMQNQELRSAYDSLEKARDSVRLSEARYRELYESAPLGYLSVNAAGDVVEANRTLAALLDLERERILGRRLSDFVLPEYQDEWYLRRREVLEGGLDDSVEIALQRSDGKAVPVALVLKRAQSDEDPSSVLRVGVLDLSLVRRAERELLEAERRIRTMANALPVLVAYVDREERYRFANAAHERWFGIERSRIDGAEIREVLGDGAYAHIEARVRHTLRGATTRFEEEIGFRHGGRRYVAVMLAPHQEEDGSVAGFYLLIDDRTELRRAELALREAAAREILAEEQERRRLGEDLHDDVGQSLSLAAMRLSALEDTAPEPLRRQVREVARLVRGSRERVSSLSFQLSPAVLYDLGLVAALESLNEDLEGSYGLRVRIDSEDSLPFLDEATRVILFRTLRELLMNVARHARTDEARVRIASQGRDLTIAVSDRGIGFDAHARQTGFGLLSVRERIRQLGGRIEIEATPGGGTAVSIAIPLTCGED